MYCPKCGIENQLEQKYCRGCGHQLAGHRVVLEGNFEEAVANLKKGAAITAAGILVAGICKLNILLNWFAPNAGNVGVVVNIIIALTIALPLLLVGIRRLVRAASLLSPKEKSKTQPLEESDVATIEMNTAPVAGAIAPAPVSVTEHTTLNLKEPEEARMPRRIKQS
jgi:hypothetical protein